MSAEQLRTCQRFGALPVEVAPDLKVGISADVEGRTLLPINGLRHPPEGDTTGWYIWVGEVFPDAADAFQPLHVEHLAGWCAEVIPYLALPPGWRFLIAPGYEDVWYDESLLRI